MDELRRQIVAVNLWASWCVACREEHLALVGAANAYRGDGVVFVGVDYQDQQASAVGFLDEMGRGGENYRYVSDPGSRTALDFGVFGVPETFFIDRSGTIVAKITGASTYPLLTGVLDAIIAGRQPESRSTGPVQPGPPADPTGG
jgi:cytochrome c biogenesis protein CcmG, thiol:disulfide interchange protein DsbE